MQCICGAQLVYSIPVAWILKPRWHWGKEREREALGERERLRETQKRGEEMKGDDKLLLAAERYAWHTGALHVQPE